MYLVFGVDAEAIRPRSLYLSWAVGKPPDFALEVASESTSPVDTNRKPGIYAAIGVSEFWRFDPSGGQCYGETLWSGQLVDGVYQTLPLTTEPDGILKVYSRCCGSAYAGMRVGHCCTTLRREPTAKLARGVLCP